MSPWFLIFLNFYFPNDVNSSGKLNTVFKWSWIDYLWESETHRTLAILSGEYNYTKPVLIDVDVWKGGKIFVTVIRSDGVPASLNTISGQLGRGGPLLLPYPSWRWARRGDCNAITNVFRVAIDECDRLWVLDTGKIDEDHICPAQLLAFDLHTDLLIKRIKIPKSIAQNNLSKHGLLVTPIVETVGPFCTRTYVYMADVTGNGLVIYNGTSLWRLESPVYAPQEIAAHVTIANETFFLDDGVLGMALSPKTNKPSRYLMFRPLASFDMVSVKTTNLQDSFSGDPIHYMLVSKALPSQAAAMAFSTEGTLFFGLTHDLAIACWHIDKPITKDNIVIIDRDEHKYQFVSGVKIIPRWITRKNEEIWIVTNRYQKIALDTQDFSEINFRIMVGNVDKLIDNTNCSPTSGFKFLRDYNQFIK